METVGFCINNDALLAGQPLNQPGKAVGIIDDFHPCGAIAPGQFSFSNPASPASRRLTP